MAILNKSLAPFLVDENVIGVIAAYEDHHKKEEGKFYKSVGLDIKVGDLIIVPAKTRLGFTTNKVLEVNVQPDFEKTTTVQWVAGVCTSQHYDSLVASEDAMLVKVREAEQNQAKEELKVSLASVMGVEGMKMLEINPAPVESDEE